MHTCRLAPTIGLTFSTHLPTSADWLLRRFTFRIGGIAPISPDDRVGIRYTPTDERRFSVGSWRYRRLPVGRCALSITHQFRSWRHSGLNWNFEGWSLALQTANFTRLCPLWADMNSLATAVCFIRSCVITTDYSGESWAASLDISGTIYERIMVDIRKFKSGWARRYSDQITVYEGRVRKSLASFQWRLLIASLGLGVIANKNLPQ